MTILDDIMLKLTCKISVWSFIPHQLLVYICFSSIIYNVPMSAPNNSWEITVHIHLTRNEHYASFSQARLGILTGRLGKFPSYSYPPLFSTEYLAWWQNPFLFSWTGLFLMCLWCCVWSVSLNGLYLFIPAAHRLMRCFPRSLPGAFLSWNARMFNLDP